MDTTNFDIHITPTLIESWKNELAELERKMEVDRQKRNLLMQRLHALQFFVDGDALKISTSSRENIDDYCDMPDVFIPRTKPSIQEMSPRQIISFWLSEKVPHGSGVSVKYLRESIDGVGYPMERFGRQCGYFYTLLKRMEESSEISRDGDNKVSLKNRRI